MHPGMPLSRIHLRRSRDAPTEARLEHLHYRRVAHPGGFGRLHCTLSGMLTATDLGIDGSVAVTVIVPVPVCGFPPTETVKTVPPPGPLAELELKLTEIPFKLVATDAVKLTVPA